MSLGKNRVSASRLYDHREGAKRPGGVVLSLARDGRANSDSEREMICNAWEPAALLRRLASSRGGAL